MKRLDGQPKRSAIETVPHLTTRDTPDGGTRFYIRDVLVAVTLPPRAWDMPHQWRALAFDGRGVEVNGPQTAYRRARAYAELLAPLVTETWRKVVEF